MELLRVLGALAEPPVPEHRSLADLLGLGAPAAPGNHDDLFGFQLFPYAAVYLGAEGMLGGEARDRVAGFWRALGLTPPAEPDHLSVLLALYAELVERETGAPDDARRERWRHARRALFWEHLASWLPPYLGRLAEIAPPFYRRWGELLGEALAGEAAALGPPRSLPLHLREAPPMADPRRDEGGAEEGNEASAVADDSGGEGAAGGAGHSGPGGAGEAFLGALLAPVRSGIILVRSDLLRAARELGLGTRIGERRYVLRALLGQDAPATLRWLAGEAGRQAGLNRAARSEFVPVMEFWATRAERTADLLSELADPPG